MTPATPPDPRGAPPEPTPPEPALPEPTPQETAPPEPTPLEAHPTPEGRPSLELGGTQPGLDQPRETAPARPRKRTTEAVETDPRALRRDGDVGPSLVDRMRERVGRATGRLSALTRLDRLGLQGRFPAKLLAAPADPWPGRAEWGTILAAGMLPLPDGPVALMDLDFAKLALPEDWAAYVHGFAWLRDLAAAPTEAQAAARVQAIVNRWLTTCANPSPLAWRPDLSGQRLLMWIGHAGWVVDSEDQVYRSAVLASMARFGRHLVTSAHRVTDGLPRLKATAGLTAACLVLPGFEARLAKASDELTIAIERLLMADGGVVTRSPADLLEVLHILLTMRELYQVRAQEAPPLLLQAIDRMGPALKGLLHGDGRLASFHGGSWGPPEAAAHALSVAALAPKALRNAAHSGYQRLEGGKSVVIVDTGPPPPGLLSAHAHAGALAFEFSDGTQRLVVNCGSAARPSRTVDSALLNSLRTTAAHSTLIIRQAPSTVVRSDGVLGKGVAEVTVVRRENEDGTWIDAAHDGYQQRFGLRHERTLFLRGDGYDLRGEDRLVPAGRTTPLADLPVALRFHLAPGISAVLTQGGQSAALKLPNGAAWMFRCRGGAVTLDQTLILDGDERARPATQIVVSAGTQTGGLTFNWLFQRSR